MAKFLVSLLVMLVVGVCLVHGEDTRIKMCGRDLIRLVVSSCGNSRQRRSAPGYGRHQRDSFWDVLNLLHTDPSSATLASLDTQEMAPFGQREDQDQGVSTEKHQAAAEVPSIPSQSNGETEEFPLAQRWYPWSSRMRRTAERIPDVCCQRGCSMKELIQFC